MTNIHERCPCGADIIIDTGTSEKVDKSVSEMLADWRAGHSHGHGSSGNAKAVPAF